MYTTPLSPLISYQSLNHHLYADNTQLFISFTPKALLLLLPGFKTQSQFYHPECPQIYLLLNPSKTEFMLIGLPQQISKITNPSLFFFHQTLPQPLLTLLVTLVSSSTQILPSLNKSLPYLVLAITTSATLAISDILDLKTASTITTSIVHSKLNYCNSLYLNLPKCRFLISSYWKTLLLVP